MKQIAFLVLALAVLMIAGCTETPQSQNNTTNVTPPPPPAVKNPTISISSPISAEVMTVPGNSANVTLTVTTQNLVLKKPGGAAKKGEGYLRVTLDNNAPLTVATKAYTLENVPLGAHTLKVELYNNDNTAYSPAIVKTTSFTIQKEKPKDYVPQTYIVTVKDNKFDPANLTIKVKDSVTWVNNGNVPVTATCTENGKVVFDTKSMAAGKNATLTFTEVLECEYYSQLFRATKGYLKVEPNGVD
jgi:plastocyanin